MGFFSKLTGKKEEKTSWKSPQYNEIRRWIESRIGPIDPSNPQFSPKLNDLVAGEVERMTNELMRNVVISHSDGNTILTGDTNRIKRQLKMLGFDWDKGSGSWVLRGRILQKHEIYLSSRLGGLLSYVNMIEYRAGLE